MLWGNSKAEKSLNSRREHQKHGPRSQANRNGSKRWRGSSSKGQEDRRMKHQQESFISTLFLLLFVCFVAIIFVLGKCYTFIVCKDKLSFRGNTIFPLILVRRNKVFNEAPRFLILNYLHYCLPLICKKLEEIALYGETKCWIPTRDLCHPLRRSNMLDLHGGIIDALLGNQTCWFPTRDHFRPWRR